MTEPHDIAIIGAGPAGASTAYYLARAGLSVLLLDRAEFPRDKTCGDGLTPLALRVLEDMGLLDMVLAQGHQLSEIVISSPAGGEVNIPIPPLPRMVSYGVIIPRLILDEMMLERAIEAGANYHGGVHVLNVTSDSDGITVKAERNGKHEHFSVRAAVIATGANTRLLGTIGLLNAPRHMLVAARAYYTDIRDLDQRFQIRFDGAVLPGYGWVFPLSGTSANVGAGFVRQGTGGQVSSESVRSAFERFLESSAMRRQLNGAQRSSSVRSFPIRTDFRTAPTYANRILLVGEAAGLVNPLSGDGIDFALESGRMAADHLIAMFTRGDFSPLQFAAYDRRLRRHYTQVFRVSEWIGKTCVNRPMINLLVATSAHLAWMPRQLVQRIARS
jgi:geranylgeranyl reductase family protein